MAGASCMGRHRTVPLEVVVEGTQALAGFSLNWNNASGKELGECSEFCSRHKEMLKFADNASLLRVLAKPACSHGNAFGWVNCIIFLPCSGFCLVKILNKALRYKWQKLQSYLNVVFDWRTSGNTGSCTSERRSLTGMWKMCAVERRRNREDAPKIQGQRNIWWKYKAANIKLLKGNTFFTMPN